MNRIMVIGGPGSGKSTLARELGQRTGLPVVHIDLIHWLPGWVERAREEKLPMIHAAEDDERWIIEGGLSATYPTRFARADLVVWLDLPIALRLWRVLKRRFEYAGGQTRPDLPDNCPETLNWEFFHYIVTSRRRARRRHLQMMRGPGGEKMIRLGSPRAISRWLATMPGA